MSVLKDQDISLTGKTLKVYRYAIRQRKPIGIREVQRAFNFSSPALASYHIAKLEEAGLLRQTTEGYVVDRMILENFVKLRRLLIPKYFFFSLFFAIGAMFEIILFRPSELTREYVFATIMIIIAASSYAYETIITVMKKRV